MLEVTEIPYYNVLMIYLSTAGSFIGVIITIILLTNIAYNVYKLRTTKATHVRRRSSTTNKPSNSKATVYTLSALFFSWSMLSCIAYAFIRNNVITRVNINNYTENQCIVGFLMGYTFGVGSRIFFYFVFIHRIKTVFGGSAYDYHPCIYRTGYIWCCTIFTFIITLRYYLLSNEWNDFYIEYNQETEILFCSAPLGENSSQIVVTTIYFVQIAEFFTNIILLSLFIKGLYALRSKILEARFKSMRNVIQMCQTPTPGIRINPQYSYNKTLFNIHSDRKW